MLFRKLLCLSLSALLAFGCLSACGGDSEPAETTAPHATHSTSAPTEPATEPATTEPAEEAKVLKVLTLGHSLAVDSNHMINLVAATEGIGDYEELVIGTLYYSGCRLSQHVAFIQSGEAAYNLYLSSTQTGNKPPEVLDDITMEQALRFDYWDIIVMMGNPWEIDSGSAFENGNIQTIQKFVNEKKMNPLAYFAWHMPWAAPMDTDLLNMYPHNPNSHYTNAVAYGLDKNAHFQAMTRCVEQYILTDETFKLVIPTGTAIQNAWSGYMEDKDLHRDYFHATDMARAMTSYVWYCRLMGIEKLEELKLDAIPKAFLKSTEDKTRDRVLTESEKAVMLESINNALSNPYQMTQSQYTEQPTQ